MLPLVASTFKGVTPSELAERWGEPDGLYRMDIDMAVAAEINDQIAEAQESSGSSKSSVRNRAKGAVARREQRRSKMKGGD